MLQSNNRVLQGVIECHRVLEGVTEFYRVLQSISSASTWTNFWACFLEKNIIRLCVCEPVVGCARSEVRSLSFCYIRYE